MTPLGNEREHRRRAVADRSPAVAMADVPAGTAGRVKSSSRAVKKAAGGSQRDR
jgi:hypothetical protein